MCIGGGKTPPPQTPATPPPPPPVLEQAAPEVSAPTQSQQLKNRSVGTKQYRNPLTIGTSATVAGNSLGVAT